MQSLQNAVDLVLYFKLDTLRVKRAAALPLPINEQGYWFEQRNFEIIKLLQKVCITLILLVMSPAFSGPPMITDDTGVLDPGAWEVIVWAAGESRPATDSTEFPTVEVSYGFYENMQLTAAVNRQVIEDRGEPSTAGWGNGAIAYKWQFYNNDGKTVAFAPA